MRKKTMYNIDQGQQIFIKRYIFPCLKIHLQNWKVTEATQDKDLTEAYKACEPHGN